MEKYCNIMNNKQYITAKHGELPLISNIMQIIGAYYRNK